MNDFDLLISRLRQWQRWTRLQKAIYYGVCGLALGFLVSAIAGIFLIPSSTLLVSEYFVLLAASGALGLVIAIGLAWLWPGSRLKMAREYEQTFDLKERVSTAIELSQLDRVDQPWRQLQLSDALEATRQIIPKDGLKWRIPKAEISLLLVAFGFVLGSWFYGQRPFQQAETNAQNRQLVENEAKNLEELISKVQNSEQLSDETKQAVLSPLKQSLEDLKQADSLNGAVSALSKAQQTLEESSAPGTKEFEGLKSAGEELAKNQESPLSSIGETLSQGNLQAAAEKLAALDLGGLNPQESAGLAQQLLDTAHQLDSSSPEVAKHLQKAAQALQSNDLQAAQEAMAEASQALSDSIQRAAFSKAARESADNLANIQGHLMAASMFGSSAQNANTQANSSESPKTEQKGSFGSKAGSGGFEESKTPGKEVGPSPVSQNNMPGNSAEKQYDSVYAPQRLGGASETDLSLGTNDAESNAIGGIDSSVTQNAQSSVPYSEVYSSYKESAQQALESGSIPLSLQPIVRDYFSSLDPK
jgi:hypothetical protein